MTVDGYYLAGLTDGEGCFSIRSNHSNKPTETYSCAFIIKMRVDDKPLLEELRETLGIGNISIESGQGDTKARKPSARWVVSNKAGCLALVELFDNYQLRSKKARDFQVWRRAVLYWDQPDFLSDGTCRIDWSPMAAYRDELKRVRQHPWDRGQLFEVPA